MFPGVTRFSWEVETVGIGKWDTDPLRLGPSVRSHPRIAIRGSSSLTSATQRMWERSERVQSVEVRIKLAKASKCKRSWC